MPHESQIASMRPKSENPKSAKIDVRMHKQLRDALEEIAHREQRSLSQLCEMQLRKFAIEYLQAAGEDATEIQGLP